MSLTKKNILLVSQFFFPENFKSNDIAFELSKSGYNVDVLCGIPNYPQGKYYKGYNIFNKRIEKIGGIKVYRVLQSSRGNKKNGIMLSCNYLSFAFFSSFWALLFCMTKRYQSIIVHQTSPITQALPALIINFFRKTPIFLWVLDLWPEAFTSGSGINNSYIYNLIKWFTTLVYSKSKKILISSHDFKKSIILKGDLLKKIIYFPNWSIDFKDTKTNQIDLSKKIPDGFIIMFAGNIGKSQDVESIINLASELVPYDFIKFVIIGEGSSRKWLENRIIKLGLKDKVKLLGQYPQEDMPALYNMADAMLLTLSGEYPDLSLYVPAKLQSYMSAGKPILGMATGSANSLINKARCGYAVNSGDYKQMADIIINKVIPNRESFGSLGENGRSYYEDNFTLYKCINNLCIILENN